MSYAPRTPSADASDGARRFIRWAKSATPAELKKLIADYTSQPFATPEELAELARLRIEVSALKLQLTSKLPLFPNPWPDGIYVEWISGRGWVPIKMKKRKTRRGS